MFRFAPSPTGDMHIGNLRIALFNFILSRQTNEKFIIRIEDTDKERNIEGKDREILEILNLFNIEYQDVFYQSKNIKFHRQLATRLLSEKKAFICFCTPEELEEEREKAKREKRAYKYSGRCEFLQDIDVLEGDKPFVIRIKRPDTLINFMDRIKGSVTFHAKEIDSFVIMREDNTPTYNFACAVDDMLHNISFIIRGEDHLSNTPKQELIRRYFKYEKEIAYAHVPIILNEEGKKMSKRDKASSVKWLLEEGFLPEAITNYLVLIGNNTPKKIFTLYEVIEWFDINKISKSPAKFDLNQLRDINREHIKRVDDLKLASLIGYSSEEIGKLAKIYLEEASTIKEIKRKIDKIFTPKRFEDEILNRDLEMLKLLTREAPHFEEFNDFKKYLMKSSGLKGRDFFQPLRFLFTGATKGPKLQDIYPYIKNYLKEIAK